MCWIMFLLDIPGQPHGGEVSPAQFTNNVIFSIVKVSYFHMMVATYKNNIRP